MNEAVADLRVLAADIWVVDVHGFAGGADVAHVFVDGGEGVRGWDAAREIRVGCLESVVGAC